MNELTFLFCCCSCGDGTSSYRNQVTTVMTIMLHIYNIKVNIFEIMDKVCSHERDYHVLEEGEAVPDLV